MAREIVASVRSELYPEVRVICGGALPDTYDEWRSEKQRMSFRTTDLNPQSPVVVDVDIEGLRAFVAETHQVGETALHNYAVDKARRQGLLG